MTITPPTPTDTPRMFGLSESEVLPLMDAISTDENPREAFARATWTGIIEPGDSVAGFVTGILGAAGALELLVERTPVDVWLSTLNGITAAFNTPQPMTEEELTASIERWTPRAKSAPALMAIRQAARYGAKLLTPASTLWPEGLADLGPAAPAALWVRGTDTALEALKTSIALVGARAATGYGEHISMEAASGLVDRGFAVVSGAAYGIDGMAHRAALASRGQTIAFLAGGVDRFYPSGHDTLLSKIVESGAVVSELPMSAAPTKWRFLMRNRLVAAVSQATVVIEAGWRSGSLNTAGHARELGRPLGAVPGPVTSAASAGCHRLIRDHSATLVTCAEEMAALHPERLREGN
jgi:DNA processing protein